MARGVAAAAGGKGGAGKKKGSVTFVIDCAKPVDDKIMEIASLEKFLQERIKVARRQGRQPRRVRHRLPRQDQEQMKAYWYLKYLTKKYLKKHNVRDWLRVIASNKDRNVYELRYFNIAENEGEEED
ncbi:hypothetical protein OsJ_10802 [Oryza sativa Japonica Group]|uniref:60S ribosomal protein L22 n=1 Tax=Oryza sativa subsp. japonica TaxID=39947 RepID=B9F8E4_ORYSJ|nr:hypothetical protein OsJ_10802 [Oryza sativa Japonica Group]